MVITLILALGAAFVLSLTFVPALIAILMTGPVVEKKVRAIVMTKTCYEPLLRRAVAQPLLFIGAGIAVLVLAGFAFTFIGREFMPTLDAQNLSLSSVRIPSTSIDQSTANDLPLERAVLTLPEMQTVYSKAGTASLAADPMPQNASDNYIILKSKSMASGCDDQGTVDRAHPRETAFLVGNNYDVTQPIEMRFNELIGGVRSDVCVKIYGKDLDKLADIAKRVAAVLHRVPGSTDVRVAQTEGFRRLTSRSTALPSRVTG